MRFSPYSDLDSTLSNRNMGRQMHYAILGANPAVGINDRAALNTSPIPGVNPKLGHRGNHKSMSDNSKQDPLQSLKTALKAVKGHPDKIASIAKNAMNAPGLKNEDTPKVTATILENTAGADKLKVMADMSQTSAGQQSINAMSRETASLRGADLSTCNPKDVASVVGPNVDMSGAKFPPGVDLSQKNLDGVTLNLASAHDLKVAGAKGDFKVTGDFTGGGNDKYGRDNAALLASMGAKVDPKFSVTNQLGERQNVAQAMNGGGLNNLSESMKPSAFKMAPTPFA